MVSDSSVGVRASRGGGVYRHALTGKISDALGLAHSEHGWCDPTLALACVLMSWDAAPTLAQRFDSTLTLLDRVLPRRRRTGRTYQGFVKAWSARSDSLVRAFSTHLREQTRALAGTQWKLGCFVPIGVDGSKFDAPRTISNEPLGFAGKDKCGPQMTGVLLVHLGAMLPWAWARAGVRTGERALLRSMLDVLPDAQENTLLVADAGFTGFELLSELRERNVHFLIRVGKGVRLLTELGFTRREGRHTVYLWPTQHRDRPPLTLRLIRVGDVYLLTDITDPRELSKAMASELYRRRWGLEVAFRTLKQTLERRKVRSRTRQHALRELDWSVLGLWTLCVIGAQDLSRTRAPARSLSVAAALRTVRHAAHANPRPRTLSKRLSRCTLDTHKRRSPKAAYQWPHKKHQTPPSPPTIATATKTQTKAAAQHQSPKPNG